MRKLVIVGSTGSIGTQALDVVERGADLEVVGLGAASSWELLSEQAGRPSTRSSRCSRGRRAS